MDNFFLETLERTRAFEGQYPRPWMTDLTDPLSADCFIVGRNQRNGYQVTQVGPHQRHVDALFNRNGETCRGLYESLFSVSPTRKNIDRLSKRLRDGGAKVLETNVICFSTPMSADLTSDQRHRGTEIFAWLLERIKPTVIIVHGAGAAKDMAKLNMSSGKVIQMESLALPAYNKWHSQSEEILDQVAGQALAVLRNRSR